MSLEYRDDEFHGCAVIVQDLNPVPKACGDKFRPGQQRGVRCKDRRHRSDHSQETLNETPEINSLLLSRLTVFTRPNCRLASPQYCRITSLAPILLTRRAKSVTDR